MCRAAALFGGGGQGGEGRIFLDSDEQSCASWSRQLTRHGIVTAAVDPRIHGRWVAANSIAQSTTAKQRERCKPAIRSRSNGISIIYANVSVTCTYFRRLGMSRYELNMCRDGASPNRNGCLGLCCRRGPNRTGLLSIILRASLPDSCPCRNPRISSCHKSEHSACPHRADRRRKWRRCPQGSPIRISQSSHHIGFPIQNLENSASVLPRHQTNRVPGICQENDPRGWRHK